MNELTAEFEKTFIRDDRYKVFVTGFKNTILITLVSLCVGLIAGILIAIARYGFRQMKRKAAVTWYAKLWYAICWVADKILALYVAVIRGVPLVVQLLIMAFVVMAGFPNKIVVCCIAMGLNSAAYVSEVVRGGINAVDVGQMEAGRSLGLSTATTIFFIIFIFSLIRGWKPMVRILPDSFSAFITSTASSSVTVNGFSSITFTPALRA